MAKAEEDGKYDANKYFYIMKMALDIKNNKMMVQVLGYIQVSDFLYSTTNNSWFLFGIYLLLIK